MAFTFGCPSLVGGYDLDFKTLEVILMSMVSTPRREPFLHLPEVRENAHLLNKEFFSHPKAGTTNVSWVMKQCKTQVKVHLSIAHQSHIKTA